MSRYCPIVGEKVLYTAYLECDEKSCKNNVNKSNNEVNDSNDRKNDRNSKEKQRAR